MISKEEFKCSSCLKEVREDSINKVIGTCQSCQDKFDREAQIRRAYGNDDEESFTKRYERAGLDKENLERTKLGLPKKEIPEALMNEEEFDEAIHNKLKERNEGKMIYEEDESCEGYEDY